MNDHKYAFQKGENINGCTYRKILDHIRNQKM